MQSDMHQCREVLQNAVRECESQWIALYAGLDSSILAHLRKDRNPQAITIITKDFLGTDLTFAQIIAKHTGLPLSLIQVTMEEAFDSINETIKIIDNYGIDGDFVESQAFAFLAIRSIEGMYISFPSTTRCKEPSTGGTIVENF